MEDSQLATGAPDRMAIKFGRWEKNLATFVKLQVWKSVKILVYQSYYYRKKKGQKLGPFWLFLEISYVWWPASLSVHYLFLVDKVHMYCTIKQIDVFVMAPWSLIKHEYN